MAIIPAIGRKSLKLRVLIFSIYTILVLGSITTVYPFTIMIATSMASHTDFEHYRLIPRYLYNNDYLAAKYLQDKNREHLFDVFKLRYRIEEPVPTEEGGFRRYGRYVEMIHLLEPFDLSSPQVSARIEDWLEFKAQLPRKFSDTYYQTRLFPLGETQVGFQNYLRSKYPTAELLRAGLDEMPKAYVLVSPPYDAYERHAWYPARDSKSVAWEEYRATLPPRALNAMTVGPLYQKSLLDKYSVIENLNSAWGSDYAFFWEIPFPHSLPADASAEDWEEYVRRKMPMRYARLDVDRSRADYTAFLRAKYGTVEKYNGLVDDDAPSLEEARLEPEMPEISLRLADWQEFYERHAPLDAIILDNADIRYARFLQEKHGGIDAVNAAYGTDFASLESVEPPYRQEDYWDLATRRSALKWDYLTRNYRLVLKRVFFQGRPIMNTTILVLLTVGTAVTVNPLAAYALSRYRLSYTSKVLVFMLATMAFPAEVAMIPNFLMIKRLGLMNTFGALVLPGLASGYFVFLLKGFFDSLPAELYEAASIDGAGEFRMFWTITLPLSLPVLSVIALFAFGGAYGSFLWAFTTCQDPKMWTLMVFLQQFQIEASSCPYLVMASLVLAAIPTMIVFLSAQKVLMKGIVVPTMK